MSDFRNYLNEQLQRPSFKAEWDALPRSRSQCSQRLTIFMVCSSSQT